MLKIALHSQHQGPAEVQNHQVGRKADHLKFGKSKLAYIEIRGNPYMAKQTLGGRANIAHRVLIAKVSEPPDKRLMYRQYRT